MAKEIDRDVLSGFIDEARGYMPQILDGLDHLHREAADFERLEQTHRLTHSIKGAAGMLGLSTLAGTAYRLEEAVEQVAAGQLPAGPETAATLLGAATSIGRYLDQLNVGTGDEKSLATAIVTGFRRLRGLPSAGDQAEIDQLCADANGDGQSPEPEAPSSPFAPASGPEPASDADPASDVAPAPDADPAAFADTESPSTRPQPKSEIATDLLEAFREEARDHLAEAAVGLRRLAKQPEDRESLAAVRRTIHTLKGAAAMIGESTCADLAHRMEDLLDAVHDADDPPRDDQIDLLLTTADALEDLVEALPDSPAGLTLDEIYDRYDDMLGGSAEPSTEATPLATTPLTATSLTAPSLTDLSADAPPAPTAQHMGDLGTLGEAMLLDLGEKAEAEPAPVAAPTAERGPTVRVPLERLDDVVRLISELVVNSSTFERHLRSLGREVGELRFSTDRLKKLSRHFENEVELSASSTASGAAIMPAMAVAAGAGAWSAQAIQGFDELEFDRYTEIHRISRQFGEVSNDLNALDGGLHHRLGDFESYLNRASRLTGEIQDKLMRLRMVPLAQLSSRLHRVTRVTAGGQGKKVDLEIEGEQTALDKTVLDEIGDPLLHLLRNAVDHGIEPPSLRQALGKDESGRIRLRAFHQGTQVVLEVADDGGGLDDDKLRARAIEGGWLDEAEALRTSGDRLHRLIFEPGFTTAAEVSEVSGRGVGLDVVASVIDRLEGTVAVRSVAGEGTTFIIRLPMTMAILRAVLVGSGEQTYALPLAPIRQILRLEAEDLEVVGRKSVVRVRDEAYPAIRLSEALGHPAAADVPRRFPALILDLGDTSIALLVDRIVEARDVVVKNLGTLLRRIPAVNGATLMGDGSVVLILDPHQLATAEASAAFPSARATRAGAANAGAASADPARTGGVEAAAAPRSNTVLVVDDSVSVRRVLSNLLRTRGWQTVTARDGLEALETLQRQDESPAAILLDIEMPRMNGYELTASLRSRELYRDVPIIMLTSRAGDKHRQRAFELGASEYLVKPFQEEALFRSLRRLTRGEPAADERA